MSAPGNLTPPEPPRQDPPAPPGIPDPPTWPDLDARQLHELSDVCSHAAGHVLAQRYNGTQPDVGAYRRDLDARMDDCGMRSPEDRARLHDELARRVALAERMATDALRASPRTPGPGAAGPGRGRGPTRYGWEAAADRIQAKAQRTLPDPEPGPLTPRPRPTEPARETPGRTPEARPSPGAPEPRRPLINLPRVALAVYAVIAAHGGQGRWAWPSRTTIARKAGCSTRSVARAIPYLRQQGRIETKRRTGYRGRRGVTLLYRVIPEALQ